MLQSPRIMGVNLRVDDPSWVRACDGVDGGDGGLAGAAVGAAGRQFKEYLDKAAKHFHPLP
jgi:hypothetical protein